MTNFKRLIILVRSYSDILFWRDSHSKHKQDNIIPELKFVWFFHDWNLKGESHDDSQGANMNVLSLHPKKEGSGMQNWTDTAKRTDVIIVCKKEAQM